MQNLAAFMTVSNLPTPGIASIEELVVANQPACVRTGDPNQPLFDVLLPSRLTYNKMPYDNLATSVRDGTCQAAITPRTNFDLWMTDGRNCDMTIVGGSLVFASAGWITNLNASRCVQRPIEWALQQMAGEGVLNRLMLQWIRPARCTVDEDTQEPVAGRRLDENRPAEVTSPAIQQSVQRRRLRVGDASAAAGAGGNSSVLSMIDIAGILLLWGIATLLVVGTRMCIHARSKMMKARAKREQAKKMAELQAMQPSMTSAEYSASLVKLQSVARGKFVRKRRNAGLLVLDGLFGVKTSEAPSFNSTDAAVRHMVNDVHFLKQYVTGVIEQQRKKQERNLDTSTVGNFETTSDNDISSQGKPPLDNTTSQHKANGVFNFDA